MTLRDTTSSSLPSLGFGGLSGFFGERGLSQKRDELYYSVVNNIVDNIFDVDYLQLEKRSDE